MVSCIHVKLGTILRLTTQVASRDMTRGQKVLTFWPRVMSRDATNLYS